MKIFSFLENSISEKYLFFGNTFTQIKRSLRPFLFPNQKQPQYKNKTVILKPPKAKVEVFP